MMQRFYIVINSICKLTKFSPTHQIFLALFWPMRSITPPEHKHLLYLSVYQPITWIPTQIFFSTNVQKKPAVCSKFRECAKATRSQKSVASWSRWPYCIFLINEWRGQPLLCHKLLAVLDIDITLLRTLHLSAHQVIDAVVLALCLHYSRGIDGRRGELARVNLDIVPEFLPAHACWKRRISTHPKRGYPFTFLAL